MVWTRLAVHDLYCIREYIAADNPNAAQTLIDMIAEAIEQLPAYPQLGRIGRVRGTR
ncbi:MAG TPA: type II toxin-antitoxin system mRNA interferase toxin, RelE/StbE family, partial [Deltaproteobacteria bacterium]|nr:type II toxin-antitoxin system mRNA interferase toxin, RelE/StbE family [Deltaproteobacteria bacterium]